MWSLVSLVSCKLAAVELWKCCAIFRYFRNQVASIQFELCVLKIWPWGIIVTDRLIGLLSFGALYAPKRQITKKGYKSGRWLFACQRCVRVHSVVFIVPCFLSSPVIFALAAIEASVFGSLLCCNWEVLRTSFKSCRSRFMTPSCLVKSVHSSDVFLVFKQFGRSTACAVCLFGWLWGESKSNLSFTWRGKVGFVLSGCLVDSCRRSCQSTLVRIAADSILCEGWWHVRWTFSQIDEPVTMMKTMRNPNSQQLT